jgi:hypothetical protein
MKDKFRAVDLLLAVLVFGSIWGLVEVVGGGALKMLGIPTRAVILTGLGLGLMAMAFAVYRKAWVLFAAPVIAMAVKQLVVPVLGLPMTCMANGSLAVFLEGAAFGGAAIALSRQMEKSFASRATAGFAGGFLGGTAFWAIGMRLAPCAYLLSFNSGAGFFRFMAHESLLWAAFSALTVPIGYALGEKIRDKVGSLAEVKTSLYYSGAVAAIALCWGVSAFAITKGF